MIEKHEKKTFIGPCLKASISSRSVETCPDVSLSRNILNALSYEWHGASTPAPWGKYTGITQLIKERVCKQCQREKGNVSRLELSDPIRFSKDWWRGHQAAVKIYPFLHLSTMPLISWNISSATRNRRFWYWVVNPEKSILEYFWISNNSHGIFQADKM